jgi:hypothetical protein
VIGFVAAELAKPRPTHHTAVTAATNGPQDRILLILKIAGVVAAIIAFVIVCLIAAAAAIFVGPLLLVVALVAWVAGADWAPTCAVAGGVCTAVGIFANALNG